MYKKSSCGSTKNAQSKSNKIKTNKHTTKLSTVGNKTHANSKGSIKSKKPYDPALFKVKGLLKTVTNHILKTSVNPQEIFAMGGSIALLSLLIGNKYVTSDGIYSNLYIIGMGPTGSGKEAPRGTVKDTAVILDLAETVPDSLASAAGLEDYLSSLDEPILLLLIDEFGKFLQHKNKSDDFGITAILLKLFTSVNNVYIPRIKAGRPSPPLINPFVSLYGTTTEEAMESALSEADSESGWLGRFLFLKTNTPRPVFQTKQQCSLPKDIELWFDAVQANTKQTVTVNYSKVARNKITSYQTMNDNSLRHDTINPIIRAATVRIVEIIKKLALISSVSKDPVNPVINIDDVTWAIAVTEHSTNYVKTTLSSIIENGAASSTESRQIKKCLDIINRTKTYNETKFSQATKKGYMPKRMLLKKMGVNTQTLVGIIGTLKEREDITEIALSKEQHGIHCDTAYFITEDTT